MRTRKERWIRRLLGGAGAIAIACAVIGFAHTKAGRPLMGLLFGQRCPLGLDTKFTPEQRDANRRVALLAVRGTERASARPALGFILDTTTKADVNAWALQSGAHCKEIALNGIDCADVTASAFPAIAIASSDFDAVHFHFDAHDKLIALDTSTSRLDATAAAREVEEATLRLEKAAGQPTSRLGEPTAEHLDATQISQAGAEFRFSNYRAEISATRMGALGLLVRETYQSIPD